MSWPAFTARHVIQAISTLLIPRCLGRVQGQPERTSFPPRCPPALVMPIYQARCRERCATRAALPELRTLSSPSDATPVGLFGWFNTLKKSRLNFRSARSLFCHVSTIFRRVADSWTSRLNSDGGDLRSQVLWPEKIRYGMVNGVGKLC